MQCYTHLCICNIPAKGDEELLCGVTYTTNQFITTPIVKTFNHIHLRKWM